MNLSNSIWRNTLLTSLFDCHFIQPQHIFLFWSNWFAVMSTSSQIQCNWKCLTVLCISDWHAQYERSKSHAPAYSSDKPGTGHMRLSDKMKDCARLLQTFLCKLMAQILFFSTHLLSHMQFCPASTIVVSKQRIKQAWLSWWLSNQTPAYTSIWCGTRLYHGDPSLYVSLAACVTLCKSMT